MVESNLLVTMKWTEPKEIAAARAKLQNQSKYHPLLITISAIGYALIPLILIPLSALLTNKAVMWDFTLLAMLFCMVAGTAADLISNWNRIEILTISLSETSVIITGTKYSRTEEYKDLMGWSLTDIPNTVIPDGKLILFGDPQGFNLSIGVPKNISLHDIRKYLTEKLTELETCELPKQKNPY